MKIKCGAKINISLKILNKRKDGFHNISTVFQELDFGDDLDIKKSDNQCRFTSNAKWLRNDKSNLCVLAWMKMKEHFPIIKGVEITLEKRIPPGAGLGGGSSNAAGVIKGLNSLYKLHLDERQMKSVACSLGADVSFFIQGGTQQGEGIGDRLSILPYPVKGSVLLVIPDIHIDTSWAYGLLKNKLESVGKPPNFASFFQENLFPEEIFKNDFEDIVFPAYPEIGKVKTVLVELGAVYASLSGSGSTVYGIFNDESAAVSAETHFSSSYHTIVTFPANS
ncbi:MAG: 4-(cytidine 5'-diphospho)-2-C-methyl-D-erythritol kinase [Candidatus Marinimicrobia bacterium]|nr:4-(cytidine 5'-diphospho)-2-C-methyl-D-erythritol kinase [Candidatus Neomarinimicrobiota bacterium]